MNKIKILFTSLFFLTTLNSFAVIDSIGMKTVEGSPYIIYLVTAGETIYGISTKFQVPIDKLMAENPDLENGLRTGQIINIPYRKELVEEQKKEEQKMKKLEIYLSEQRM